MSGRLFLWCKALLTSFNVISKVFDETTQPIIDMSVIRHPAHKSQAILWRDKILKIKTENEIKTKSNVKIIKKFNISINFYFIILKTKLFFLCFLLKQNFSSFLLCTKWKKLQNKKELLSNKVIIEQNCCLLKLIILLSRVLKISFSFHEIILSFRFSFVWSNKSGETQTEKIAKVLDEFFINDSGEMISAVLPM